MSNLDHIFIERCIGFSIAFAHWILCAGTVIVILLTNELPILIIINMYLYFILILNIIFSDCPITLLEEKFLDTNLLDIYSNFFPDRYIINNRGYNSLQIILMATFAITTKIFLLILKHIFKTFLLTN
jgi:hypothetical protein